MSLFRFDLLSCFAEATLPMLVVEDRLVEIALTEVGPKEIHEAELRVGQLPEQEVADPLFATGTDEQVGIRYIPCYKIVAHGFLIHILCFEATRSSVGHHFFSK